MLIEKHIARKLRIIYRLFQFHFPLKENLIDNKDSANYLLKIKLLIVSIIYRTPLFSKCIYLKVESIFLLPIDKASRIKQPISLTSFMFGF